MRLVGAGNNVFVFFLVRSGAVGDLFVTGLPYIFRLLEVARDNRYQ